MPHADLRRADEIFERLVIMHQLIEAITLHDNLLDDHPAQPGRAVEQFGDDYRPCFRRANRNFPSRSEDLTEIHASSHGTESINMACHLPVARKGQNVENTSPPAGDGGALLGLLSAGGQAQ